MTNEAAVLVAVASPRRREILRLLWAGERSAGEINAAFPDVTFGAVSLQLRALAEAGLVTARADGRRRIYRVERAALGPLGKALERMWADSLSRLKVHAELEAARRGPKPGFRTTNAAHQPRSRRATHSRRRA